MDGREEKGDEEKRTMRRRRKWFDENGGRLRQGRQAMKAGRYLAHPLSADQAPDSDRPLFADPPCQGHGFFGEVLLDVHA